MSLTPPSPTSWHRIWTMLRDPRGPVSTKLVTLGAVLYIIWPIDLIPDIAPLLGWLDDIGVTTIAIWWLHHVVTTYKQS